MASSSRESNLASMFVFNRGAASAERYGATGYADLLGYRQESNLSAAAVVEFETRYEILDARLITNSRYPCDPRLI